MSLPTFLRTSKQAALNAVKTKGSLEGWTVAVGNEAGDLDSVACAVAYAYVASTRDASNNVVPLIQTDRRDMHLRPENELALRHASIKGDDLLCFDELGREPRFFDKAKLALVDHNKALPVFGNAHVTAIVDHHADERAHLDANPRLLEITGSCSSLLASHFQKEGVPAASLPAELADLLISAILIDTNLKPVADGGKATQTDLDAVQYLLAAGAFPGTSLVQSPEALSDRASQLRKTKSDVAYLSLNDLLRRDYKEYETNGLRYGLATVPLSLPVLLAKIEEGRTGWDLLQHAMQAYERQHDLAMLGVLTSFVRTTAKGNVKPGRELLFHFGGEDPARLARVAQAIEASEVLLVEPWKSHDDEAPPFSLASPEWALWTQSNTRATRKQVAPIVRAALEA